jgi:hypothetical protein
MPRNDRDTLTPFRLPPGSAVPEELQKPVKEYRDLISRRHAELTRIGTLERQRVGAIEKDRIALARALREGGEDPGDKAVEKIDKDLAQTRRRVEALEVAIEEAEQELIQAVDDNRSEWLEDTEAEIDRVAGEYLATVEALEAARTKLTERVTLRTFVTNFPEGKGYFAGTGGRVAGLIARHGDPYRWDEVVEALRKDAEVTKPQPVAPAEDGPLVVQEHTDRRFREAIMSGDRRLS